MKTFFSGAIKKYEGAPTSFGVDFVYPLNRDINGRLNPADLVDPAPAEPVEANDRRRVNMRTSNLRVAAVEARWRAARKHGWSGPEFDRFLRWHMQRSWPLVLLDDGAVVFLSADLDTSVRAVYSHIGISLLTTRNDANNDACHVGFADPDGTSIPEAQLNYNGQQHLMVQNLSGAAVRLARTYGGDMPIGQTPTLPEYLLQMQPAAVSLSPFDVHPVGGTAIEICAPSPTSERKDRLAWLTEFRRFARAQFMLLNPPEQAKVIGANGSSREDVDRSLRFVDQCKMGDPKSFASSDFHMRDGMDWLHALRMTGEDPVRTSNKVIDFLVDPKLLNLFDRQRIMNPLQDRTMSTVPMTSARRVMRAVLCDSTETNWYCGYRVVERLPFIIVHQL